MDFWRTQFLDQVEHFIATMSTGSHRTYLTSLTFLCRLQDHLPKEAAHSLRTRHNLIQHESKTYGGAVQARWFESNWSALRFVCAPALLSEYSSQILESIHSVPEYKSTHLLLTPGGPTYWFRSDFEDILSLISRSRFLSPPIQLVNECLLTASMRSHDGTYHLEICAREHRAFLEGILTSDALEKLSITFDRNETSGHFLPASKDQRMMVQNYNQSSIDTKSTLSALALLSPDSSTRTTFEDLTAASKLLPSIPTPLLGYTLLFLTQGLTSIDLAFRSGLHDVLFSSLHRLKEDREFVLQECLEGLLWGEFLSHLQRAPMRQVQAT